ncbi:MAG: excinuclease ABC subunit UvrA [Flavobacteriales bacterium]|mgnify:FL=1|jgi:excinuclease ABC subunit A|tara:strand:- start:4108 stop:6870 length:2763 start_codon:yes stop_codon:yes gene_type:complete
MRKDKSIFIKGARQHNLKNISLEIPKDKITVISGVSGSGKSTLAFDTLFAEGQRRYIESLSSYARQFLGKLQKPDVDEIIGICPAIAIEQKTITKNPRSTVGTSTEIYDYLKLLFARIGQTYSPISKNLVKKDSLEDIIKEINTAKKGVTIYISVKIENKNDIEEFLILQRTGFSRVFVNNKILKIRDITSNFKIKKSDSLELIIDRFIKDDAIEKSRIAESIETALNYGQNNCIIRLDNKKLHFSNKFELDGIKFITPSTQLFSFNNPFGACPRCEGYGSILGIDHNKVIQDEELSLFEGVVAPWSGQKLSKWKDRFIQKSSKFNFPIHRPYKDLKEEEKKILWEGKDKCKGINQFFDMLETKRYKIQARVMLARYRGKAMCNECKGSRLRIEASYVKINKLNIIDLCNMSINECLVFFKRIKLSKSEQKISERILEEVTNRLKYLNNVGLQYLTLSRKSKTLSGGESQRINLATSLGSSLVGAMYILDEPSIGLHSQDTEKLITILKNLRDIGNTVIVVEHDEEIMQSADFIVDVGPEAGINGGEIIFKGSVKNIFNSNESLTTKYLTKKLNIPIPAHRKKWTDFIEIKGVRVNNINNIDVKFPLQCLTVVSGVSGSGKSSLISNVLKPAVNQKLGVFDKDDQLYKSLNISTDNIKKLEFINQNPLGKSSRSNPITYIKAYDEIRSLFASQNLAKTRKYTAGTFSFNVNGGRCENCKGEGETTVEMQFMADVHLECDDCKGTRFKKEVLEIKFGNKNISEILELSVKEAIDFFSINNQHNISKKIKPLDDVGLGYIKLGQSSNTLSGGEAQRTKIASFLTKGNTQNKILFIFDEPTTGLHFHDINKLLKSFYSLISNGHSIICIEHNLDVIKCADWIIDLGPGGGNDGGKLIFSGTPEKIIECKESATGKYLKSKILI